jgi:hypothetical protein
MERIPKNGAQNTEVYLLFVLHGVRKEAGLFRDEACLSWRLNYMYMHALEPEILITLLLLGD